MQINFLFQICGYLCAVALRQSAANCRLACPPMLYCCQSPALLPKRYAAHDHQWQAGGGPPDLPTEKRTLTTLYNLRPDWLAAAHRALDHAVFAAYGWPPDSTDDEVLARLLELNGARAAAGGGANVTTSD